MSGPLTETCVRDARQHRFATSALKYIRADMLVFCEVLQQCEGLICDGVLIWSMVKKPILPYSCSDQNLYIIQ